MMNFQFGDGGFGGGDGGFGGGYGGEQSWATQLQENGGMGQWNFEGASENVEPAQKKRRMVKTQLCRHHQNGHCSLGPNCGFAHGEAELGTASAPVDPNALQFKLGGGKGGGGGGGPVKTKLCLHFQSGSCMRGSKCTFAHGEHELGTPYTPIERQPFNTGGAQQPQQTLLERFGNAEQQGSPNQGSLYQNLSSEDEKLIQQLITGSEDLLEGGTKSDWESLLNQADPQLSSMWGRSQDGVQSSAGNSELEQLTQDILRLQGEVQAGKGGGDWGASNGMSSSTGGSQPLKMKLCQFYSAGFCPKGDACGFAHGEHQLGTPQPGANAGVSSPQQQTQFKKTKLCTFFESGFCPRGDNCTFAHGEAELGTLQPPMSRPPMGKGSPGAPNMLGKGVVVHPPGGIQQGGIQQGDPSAPSQFRKTRLCNNFESGFCPRGDTCTFAHGQAQLGTSQPLSGALAGMQKGAGGGGGVGGPVMRKTRLCHHFVNGTCSRGAMCGFAHGEHELGTPQTAPGGNAYLAGAGGCGGSGGPTAQEKELFNFKTVMCNNFSASGQCPRGERCSFAHGEDELMQPGQAKAMVDQMEKDGTVPGMENMVETMFSADIGF